jgi:hypothetical protein
MQTKIRKPLSNPIAHIAKYNEAILKVCFWQILCANKPIKKWTFVVVCLLRLVINTNCYYGTQVLKLALYLFSIFFNNMK